MHSLNYIDENDKFFYSPDLNPLYNDYKNTSNRLDVLKVQTNERLTLSFLIKDAKLFNDSKKETIVLFYYLTMLAMDQRFFNIKNHRAYLTDVYELKESPEHGWCNSPGDQKLFIRSEFRILVSFPEDNKPKYYVYLNQTETLYSTGYYYLTVLYTQKKTVETLFGLNGASTPTTTTSTKFANLKESDLERLGLFDFLYNLDTQQLMKDDYPVNRYDHKNDSALLRLTDVTDIVLDQNSTNILASKLLTVCNRSPKIRVQCENHETIRLRLCELELMKDRSYCSIGMKSCFFIDEYEYDSIEPKNYIRICKSYTNHTINAYQSYIDKLKTISSKFDLKQFIAGWVSFISTVISLIFMFITFITYLLFKQIRNLPGWNIISVTFALIIAQISFLFGSFMSETPLGCFLVGLTTHYGFLASFFWMNVIAFDLYRNFRDKSSHVLLHSIGLTDRLPKYALYAWLTPLVIVLTALVVDLSVKDNFKKAPYRPCYSGYLKGCNTLESEIFLMSFNETNDVKNETFRQFLPKGFNMTDQSCYRTTSQILSKVLILNGPCWIRNGRANLIFFGLPIGIIIIVNAVFYFLTIYNIRKKELSRMRIS